LKGTRIMKSYGGQDRIIYLPEADERKGPLHLKKRKSRPLDFRGGKKSGGTILPETRSVGVLLRKRPMRHPW